LSNAEARGSTFRECWPAWVIVALYAIIAAFTFDNYGVTNDEWVQARYGELVIDYVASGFRDTSFDRLWNLAYYGPLFEVWPVLFQRLFGGEKYAVRHGFIAFSTIAGLVGVIAIARRFDRPRLLSAMAVTALLTAPAYYGHSYFNSKDIPFASAFTWAVYGLIRLPESARATIRYALLTAVTLLIRVGGAVLFPLGAAAIATQAIVHRGWRWRIPDMAGRFTLGALLAWVVMIVFWPFAHLDPLHNPIEALEVNLHFTQTSIDVLFAGKTFPNTALPRHYLIGMLAVTTPLPILTLTAIGLAVLVMRTLRRLHSFAELTVLLWLVLPVAAQAVLNSPTYDGTRHFLFLYPAMALVAGAGAVALIEALGMSRVAILLLAATMLAVVPQMVRLHPYEYIFYNAAVGGTAGAAGRYEMDYWGSSIAEAARWIHAHRCPGRPTEVVGANGFWLVAAEAARLPPDQFEHHHFNNRYQTPPPKVFDYYVAPARFGWERRYPDLPVVYAPERLGVRLAYVRGGCRAPFAANPSGP
jgi:hypothetical protein